MNSLISVTGTSIVPMSKVKAASDTEAENAAQDIKQKLATNKELEKKLAEFMFFMVLLDAIKEVIKKDFKDARKAKAVEARSTAVKGAKGMTDLQSGFASLCQMMLVALNTANAGGATTSKA